jgi:hypothetical protein
MAWDQDGKEWKRDLALSAHMRTMGGFLYFSRFLGDFLLEMIDRAS